MTPLLNQEQFESLWHPSQPTKPLHKPIIVYFTARWCKACKRLDWPVLRAAFPPEKVTFMICDIDENEYTPGYVGCRSIPGFFIILPNKQIKGPYTNSSTPAVQEWLALALEDNRNT